MREIANGIYPTMLVAYTKDNKIDYNAMEQLIEWYIKNGVHGIFALCHSTEIHKLSFEERYELAKFVLKAVNGRVDVVMSGNTEYDLDKMVKEANAFAELGPQAVIFVRNRMDGENGSTFENSIDFIVRNMPDSMPLGIYECPCPYKQYLSDDELKYLVDTKRFVFLKDTICDMEAMKRRNNIVKGSEFKLYNANCATFLETIRMGYAGFSGIMANFHPDLYSWLYENMNDPRADIIDKYIGMMSVIECRDYPICSKRYLKKYENIDITDICRSVEDNTVPALSYELNDLYELTKTAREIIK